MLRHASLKTPFQMLLSVFATGLLGGLSAGDINLLSRGHAEASAQLSAPPSPHGGPAPALPGVGSFGSLAGGPGVLGSPGAAPAQQRAAALMAGPRPAALTDAAGGRGFGAMSQVRALLKCPAAVSSVIVEYAANRDVE